MKRILNNILPILILLIFLILILVFSNEVIISILYALDIWKNNILTSLFPIFIVTDLLICYGFVDLIGEYSKNITKKLFNLPGEALFIIIASMLSGFPSSAKYISELLEKEKIDHKQAQYLLSFTHFPNPLFVIGVVGGNLLGNRALGISILISIMFGNFIISIINKDKNYINVYRNKSNKPKEEKNSFIINLTNSIFKTFNTLTLLLGIISTFLVISTIINNLFQNSFITRAIISGILEMTQGVNFISTSNVSLLFKLVLVTSFISFGGISIHLQVMSILSSTKIKYSKYFLSRILHCIISDITIIFIAKFILKI